MKLRGVFRNLGEKELQDRKTKTKHGKTRAINDDKQEKAKEEE